MRRATRACEIASFRELGPIEFFNRIGWSESFSDRHLNVGGGCHLSFDARRRPRGLHFRVRALAGM
jgi:hypothetical protein